MGFSIGVKVGRSRGSDKGSLVFMLRRNGVTREVSSGIPVSGEDLKGPMREVALKGLKVLYCLIEEMIGRDPNVSSERVANEFRSLGFNSDRYDSLIQNAGRNFTVRKEVAKVGREFRSEFKVVEPLFSDSADDLVGYFNRRIGELLEEGRKSTAQSYKATRNSMVNFLDGASLKLGDINAKLIGEYADYMRNKDVSEATITFYMRVLRTVINSAVKAGIAVCDPHIFDDMDMSVEHDGTMAELKALTREQLKRIADLNLGDDPQLDLARDLFMFSYYCRGMELTDVARLKTDNLRGQKIVWQIRQKGKRNSVTMGHAAEAILRKWRREGSDLLFPLLTDSEYESFHAARNRVGTYLRQIGQMVGLGDRLSFSVARSSRKAIEEDSINFEF